MIKWAIRLLILSVAIYFIPLGEENSGLRSEDKLSTMDALGAVSATYTDVASFCERNEEVCLLSTKFFRVVAYKVKLGAQMLLDWSDDNEVVNEDVQNDASHTDQVTPVLQNLTELDKAAPSHLHSTMPHPPSLN